MTFFYTFLINCLNNMQANFIVSVILVYAYFCFDYIQAMELNVLRL